MTCTHCKKNISDEATFCPYCYETIKSKSENKKKSINKSQKKKLSKALQIIGTILFILFCAAIGFVVGYAIAFFTSQ